MNKPAAFDAISTELPRLDPAIADAVRARWDGKTKPLGSLGDLETLAVQVAQIQGRTTPALTEPHILVFAGDHGAARDGVSAYPQDVTWQMVMNFLSGGAAISVLARELGCGLSVVDAGVNHEFADAPGLLDLKIAPGTASYLHERAMSAEQCHQAIAAGQLLAQRLSADCLLLGEMGIGNTASASLLMHHLTGVSLAECVGPGAGLDRTGLARKLAVLQQTAQHHALRDADTLAVLATFGGFEIAMLVGAALQAAEVRRVIVVDGFIVGAAILVASMIEPTMLECCVFAHRSDEAGHGLLLDALGAQPLLELGLRLGEGSGAALAWPLIESAVRLLNEMASFESAGVSERVSS